MQFNFDYQYWIGGANKIDRTYMGICDIIAPGADGTASFERMDARDHRLICKFKTIGSQTYWLGVKVSGAQANLYHR